MLKSLYIKNYALIEEVTFNPHNKLNVITGETGAGKSIILSALKLLSGAKFDENKFFSKHTNCVVEAKFEVESDFLKDFFESENLDNLFIQLNNLKNEIIIRREFTFGGRTRNFLNDTPTSLKNLTFVTDSLIDIHQQHDTLLLKDPSFQLKLIDAFAKNRNILNGYTESFKKFKNTEAQLIQQKQKAQILDNTLDYKKYLLGELEEADLENVDLQTLEKDINIAQNAETLRSSLSDVRGVLETGNNSVLSNLYTVSKILNSIISLSQDYANIHNRVESCNIELKDILYEIDRCRSSIGVDPGKHLENKAKLDTIYSLFKKHKVYNIKNLLELKHHIQEEISSSIDIQEGIDRLEKEVVKYKQIATEIAEELSKSRHTVITNLRDSIKKYLKDLGLDKTSLEMSLTKTHLSDYGIDEVKVLFSANEGHDLVELNKCASGGEMSRLMLCFRYLINSSTTAHNKTMIFDEIDTGISGEVAIKVADMMKKMGSSSQILVITHLPQVAAIGDAHYFVYKHKQKKLPKINTVLEAASLSDDEFITKTDIRLLSKTERIEAIATMIGGADFTENILLTAKQLIGVHA